VTRGRRPSCGLATILLAVAALCRCGQAPAPAAGTSGPIRIGLFASPASLDPHQYNEFVTFSVLSNVYEGLTALSPGLGVEPALAETWANPDELTWRFKLRKGVVFHDGRPLTSADVVASLERARTHPNSEFRSYLATVKGVRGAGDDGVEIVTERPTAVLLARLAFVLVVPKDAPAEITDPVGTGPYRLTRKAMRDPIVLTAFDRHWAPAPAVRAVELHVVRDPARVSAVAAGDVDMLIDVRAEDVEEARRAGLRVLSASGPAVDVLQMRIDVAPFSDPRVRRALHLALDRQAFVDRVLLGQGTASGQLVSANVFGFDPTLEPPVRDLATARRLLAEAGHPRGLDAELEFRRDPGVDEIARQLAEAEIRIVPRPRHWHELLDRLSKGQVSLAYLAMVSDSGESGDLLESTLHTKDPARGYGDSNESGYSNPALDALVEASGRTARLDERRSLLQRAMRLAMQDLPLVPVAQRKLIWVLGPRVDFGLRTDGRVLAKDLRRVTAE